MNSQSNTKAGLKIFATATDLTGKEGHLAKITNTNGVATLALTSAIADIGLFVIDEVISATEVAAIPFTADRNFRVSVTAAVNPGGTLILGTAGNAGKLAPAATGNINAVAEEIGVAGQLVLVRPIFRVLA